MSYSESPGSGNYTSLSSTAATVGLAQLRQQALPRLVDAPRFGGEQTAEWFEQVQALVGRYAAIAGVVVALALLIAAAVPAFAALQPTSTASRLGTVHSSVGVTGTAGTRVAGLSSGTFLGGLPFVQQSRVLAAGNVATGTRSSPESFVLAVRQSSIAEYIQDVGLQMVLPYLSNAAATKQNVEAWNAVIAQQRTAALTAGIAGSPYTFQAAGIAPGTVISGAHATFYSCLNNGFCGTMYNGQEVFPGAAACSWNLPLGTRFFLNADPARTVYTCLDRGALSSTWVDIWFYDSADGWAWQSMIGDTYSSITIIG